MGTAHEFIGDKEFVLEQDEKFDAGVVGPTLNDPYNPENEKEIALAVTKFQAALAVSIAEFEHQIGRKIDYINIHRESQPLEGWMNEKNEEEFFAKRPGLEKALKGRVAYVSFNLEKEEE